MELTDEGRPARNFKNGQFLKGHIPFNRGKKWSDYMDGRKARRIKRIGMQNLKGRPDIGGWNKKPVVCVRDDGRWFVFESATKAAEQTGLIRRNITGCCQGKRKHCGKYRWFYFDSNERTELVEI